MFTRRGKGSSVTTAIWRGSLPGNSTVASLLKSNNMMPEQKAQPSEDVFFEKSLGIMQSGKVVS